MHQGAVSVYRFRLFTACDWEDKTRSANQAKSGYFKELSANYQHEGFLPNEQVSLACVICTGNLSECGDLQDEAHSIYHEMVQSWIDSQVTDTNLVDDRVR